MISLSINQHDHDDRDARGRSLLALRYARSSPPARRHGCGDGKCGECTVLNDL